MLTEVPLIDLHGFEGGDAATRRRIATAIDAACRDIGFQVVSGHGVPDGLVGRMHEVSSELFALPWAAKHELEVPIDNDIGYKSAGSSYLNRTLEDDGPPAAAADWKESFGSRPRDPLPDPTPEEARYFVHDVWPSQLPGMRAVHAQYFAEMTRLADLLMEAFALGLGVQADYFRDKTDRHLSPLVVHHYPAQVSAPQPGQLRAGAHTDFTSLTLLHTGSNPQGLQVQLAGEWIDVVAGWDQFVVNVGDLMAQWSNGRWKSTLHRVINPTPERAHLERQSLTFFHTPNWHAPIRCLPNCADEAHPALYPPVLAGPYVEDKLAKLRGRITA